MLRHGNSAPLLRAIKATLSVLAVAVVPSSALRPSVVCAATPFLPARQGDWPFAVNLSGRCSGVLIHPRLVIYAAHCGEFTTVSFSKGGKTRTVPVERCQSYPEAKLEGGNDLAFCVLARRAVSAESVPDVMTDAEARALSAGTKVVVVGFGETLVGTEAQPPGLKQQIEMTIGHPRAAEIELRPLSGAVCRGDSGGPVLALTRGHRWKLLGIVSYTLEPTCTWAPAYMTRVAGFLSWIQAASGMPFPGAARTPLESLVASNPPSKAVTASGRPRHYARDSFKRLRHNRQK